MLTILILSLVGLDDSFLNESPALLAMSYAVFFDALLLVYVCMNDERNELYAKKFHLA
jgi:hypothetical protein